MKEELHTEEAAHTEPEATTSELLKLQVSVIFNYLDSLVIWLVLTVFVAGGRLRLHLIKKHTKGTGMQGVKVARPGAFKRLTSSKRTVTRAYGGVLNGSEVRERILRAFLIEEFKRFKNINTAKSGDKKDKKKKKAAAADKPAAEKKAKTKK